MENTRQEELKQRIITEAELLQGGAEYDDKEIPRATPEQKLKAHEEMRYKTEPHYQMAKEMLNDEMFQTKDNFKEEIVYRKETLERNQNAMDGRNLMLRLNDIIKRVEKLEKGSSAGIVASLRRIRTTIENKEWDYAIEQAENIIPYMEGLKKGLEIASIDALDKHK